MGPRAPKFARKTHAMRGSSPLSRNSSRYVRLGEWANIPKTARLQLAYVMHSSTARLETVALQARPSKRYHAPWWHPRPSL